MTISDYVARSAGHPTTPPSWRCRTRGLIRQLRSMASAIGSPPGQAGEGEPTAAEHFGSPGLRAPRPIWTSAVFFGQHPAPPLRRPAAGSGKKPPAVRPSDGGPGPMSPLKVLTRATPWPRRRAASSCARWSRCVPATGLLCSCPMAGFGRRWNPTEQLGPQGGQRRFL